MLKFVECDDSVYVHNPAIHEAKLVLVPQNLMRQWIRETVRGCGAHTDAAYTVADEVLYVHYARTSWRRGGSLPCLQAALLYNRSDDELRLEAQHRACAATDPTSVVNPGKRHSN